MADEETNKTSITFFKMPSWGILGMAFLIMLIAKCFGFKDDLSWWVITAPLWGPFVIAIAFIGFAYACFAAIAVIVLVIVVVCEIIAAVFKFFRNLFIKKKEK